MIADSHCHAWRQWPYEPPVPDPGGHGSIDLLLYEMDACEVERAAVVCARIGGNDDNNDYVAAAAARHPDRLSVIADVDCVWWPDHHQPGAAGRLRETAERLGITGFTHYVRAENDGWFRSDEGKEFFAVAAELDLVASLAISPAWHADLRAIASAYPTVPILIHHLGMPSGEAGLAEVLASAQVPGIHVKVSGFHYVSARSWGFPYADGREMFRRIYDAYGPRRLVWGSDFPASRPHLTYRQSLEVVRTHCDFVPTDAMPAVLGDNLVHILTTRRPKGV